MEARAKRGSDPSRVRGVPFADVVDYGVDVLCVGFRFELGISSAFGFALLGASSLACGGADGAGDDAAGETETVGEAGDGTDVSSTSTDEAGSTTDTSTSDGGDEGEPLPEPDPWAPPPALDLFPDATLVDIGAQVDAVLDAWPISGYLQSVQLVDHETGQIIYERNEDTARKPASNTKMVTSAVSMLELGKDHRVGMRALATVSPNAQGVVEGELHLVGLHDFSSDDAFYVNTTYPYYELAYRLSRAGVVSVTGATYVRGEFLVDGYSLGTYDAGLHRGFAADAWEAALAAYGISAATPLVESSFDAGNASVELARWEAPPLEVLNVPLNVQSHNEFADILGRHVGWELGGSSSYAAGGAAMLETLAGLGIDTSGFSLNDGSGLSHDNRISAEGLTQLSSAMLASALAEPWTRTFSIAGVRGTLGGRMTGADTIGRVYAKSGTLYDTITTSGVLFHVHDGRRYVFSVLLNNNYVDIDKAAARAAEDDVVEVLAENWRGVVPPTAPSELAVVGLDAGLVRIEFDAVEGADGYLVYLSEDGWNWDRAKARYITGTSFVAGELPTDGPTYVRVHAWSDTQGEGAGSDVRAARGMVGATRVLLVDGNERWAAEPNVENTRGFNPEFVVQHAESLPGELAFDSVGVRQLAQGLVELEAYDAVLWSLGEESTFHETFSDAEQVLVAAYLAQGGALMVSGAELGWDLESEGSDADRAFLHDWLHVRYAGDDAGTYVVTPSDDTGPTYGFFTPGHLDAAYPDMLTPEPGANAMLDYVGGAQAGAAAVSYVGDHRTVVLGFPFECVDNTPDRRALMAVFLETLGVG